MLFDSVMISGLCRYIECTCSTWDVVNGNAANTVYKSSKKSLSYGVAVLEHVILTLQQLCLASY